ncbi:MAG: hypothetical protein ABJL17_05825 [Parvibaculum sp.]|uniref:hypothetical protein n=1 Tax=Parvibaculum sp. TaxID=2024848 RepID=UPI00326746CE
MKRCPHDVFGERDLDIVDGLRLTEHTARNRMVHRDLVPLREHFQRVVAASAGDDLIERFRLLARDPDEPDHKVFEDTMRLDTRGELFDIGLAAGLAHVECGPLQLAKRDRHEILAHVASP